MKKTKRDSLPKDPQQPGEPSAASLVTEMLEALELMQVAAAEIAAEFIAHKHATKWAIVNDAYVKAARSIANAKKYIAYNDATDSPHKDNG